MESLHRCGLRHDGHGPPKRHPNTLDSMGLQGMTVIKLLSITNVHTHVHTVGWQWWKIHRIRSYSNFSQRILEIKKLKPKMGVSKNRGTPKWMVYSGKPYWNWWFGGTTIFGNIHIVIHGSGFFLFAIANCHRFFNVFFPHVLNFFGSLEGRLPMYQTNHR